MILDAPTERILAYLKSRARPGANALSDPGDPRKDYLESGAHPDIVERLWKDLNDGLATGSCKLAFGTPVLVNPGTSEFLAVSIGTSYAVRLPASLSENHPPDASSVITWSGGGKMDLSELFGKDWVVGKWLPEEKDWVLANTR